MQRPKGAGAELPVDGRGIEAKLLQAGLDPYDRLAGRGFVDLRHIAVSVPARQPPSPKGSVKTLFHLRAHV